VPDEDEHGTARAEPDVFASLPDAFYRLDTRGYFTYVNAAAERLLERPAEALLGRDIRDCFPETRGSVLEDGYTQVLRDGRPREFAYFHEPQQRWYEVRAFRSPGGLAVFFRDVDARHRTDRQRDETMRTLEVSAHEVESELRRRLEGIAAEAEAERIALEARLHELQRRLDELAARA